MRDTTRRRLFLDGEYRQMWSRQTEQGIVSLLVVKGRAVIVHDYPNERHGFDVYICAPGKTIDDARRAMGLLPTSSIPVTPVDGLDGQPHQE